MANIIDVMTARLVEARGENKSFPCKTYATRKSADAATLEAAKQCAKNLLGLPADGFQNAEADYIVFYMEDWGRWVGCVNQSELFHRSTHVGGYVGGVPGFFMW